MASPSARREPAIEALPPIEFFPDLSASAPPAPKGYSSAAVSVAIHAAAAALLLRAAMPVEEAVRKSAATR